MSEEKKMGPDAITSHLGRAVEAGSIPGTAIIVAAYIMLGQIEALKTDVLSQLSQLTQQVSEVRIGQAEMRAQSAHMGSRLDTLERRIERMEQPPPLTPRR
jgi:hypothetical protein